MARAASPPSERGGHPAAASGWGPRRLAEAWQSLPHRPLILLALALSAGYLDAVSYLAFGHVFTANMTGNTVLLAIAAVRGSATDAAHSATALAGFAAGGALGALILRSHGHWPRRAAAIFWLESLLLAGLLIVWVLAGAGESRYWLIALAALAMGAQSVAVRASHVRGVNTTYMTSTYLNAIARAVLRARGIREPHQDGAVLPGSAWVLYGSGAIAGALAERTWSATCVVVPLVVVTVVAISSAVARS